MTSKQPTSKQPAARRITRADVQRWKSGAEGFLDWIDTIKPRIPSSKGGFEVFKPEQFQIDFVRQALQMDDHGKFTYQTIALSLPRRHSKTLLMALLVLWRFTLFQTQNIKIIANSENQSLSTGFKITKSIILNTPLLKQIIDARNVGMYKIRYPALQSEITALNCNVSSLYGEKVTVAWCTELHAAPNTDAVDVLAGSLGDSENSWLLIDSTVDSTGGPLHKLEQLSHSGDDPTVYAYRLQYKDLAEALEKSPSWINRDWLRSMEKRLLPAFFASQHLNQRGASDNNLFRQEHIERCFARLPNPVPPAGIDSITRGKKYVCGGGLDRAYGFSQHGDKTVWTTVMKVAGEEGEDAHYYILHQKIIPFSHGKSIKKTIAEDYQTYKFLNSNIESYNCQDIATWATEAQIPNEVIFASDAAQIPAFTELERIVREGRLHFSDTLKDSLGSEMATFMYEIVNGKPRFGHRNWHDDHIYSLAWAIFSLREQELPIYELRGINCNSKSTHANLCFMRHGSLILPCKEECEAYKRVERMHLQHLRSRVDSDLSIDEFFKSLVTVNGIVSYKLV